MTLDTGISNISDGPDDPDGPDSPDIPDSAAPQDPVPDRSPATRLVPKDGTGRADVERLAGRFGWSHHRTTEASGTAPFEIVWISPDRGAAVHWIEGELTPVHYLVVGGPDIAPTVELLRRELDLHDDESLAELIDGTRDGSSLMDALNILGVHCSGPYEPQLFALFRWALNDPEPLVRRVALLSVANAGWPEFRPLVEYLRDHDPVAVVREDATAIASTLPETESP